MHNLSFLIDIEGPPIGEADETFADGAVSVRDFLLRIAEDRESAFLFLGEASVIFDLIHADHEIGDLVSLDVFGAATQRHALSRSTRREGFGEEVKHDAPLPLELTERIFLAVRSHELEIGGLVADF